MKTVSPNPRQGLSRIDVLIILAVSGILFIVMLALLLPAHTAHKARGDRINCIHNLKRLSTAFELWARDHNDQFPMQVSATDGGTLEFSSGPNAYRHVLVLSNELQTPEILVCPADKTRKSATTFHSTPMNSRKERAFTDNSQLSYFIGLDAARTLPSVLMAGDHQVTTNMAVSAEGSLIFTRMNHISVRNGLLPLATNQLIAWTEDAHGGYFGNAVTVDGSAQAYSMQQLQRALQNTGLETNRLLMP